VEPGMHVLPTASAALAHLEGAYWCVHSGLFTGTFTGGGGGSFVLLADPIVPGTPQAEFASILGINDGAQPSFFSAYGAPVRNGAQTPSFTIDSTVDSGGSAAIEFTSPDAISGTWTSNGLNGALTANGTLTGSRLSGSADAKYRFVGVFIDDPNAPANVGWFTLDVSATDAASGTGLPLLVDGGLPPTSTAFTISGTLSGSTVTGTTSNDDQFSVSINDSLALFGQYVASDGSPGYVSGVGCRLN
jgi:hypothetical protein